MVKQEDLPKSSRPARQPAQEQAKTNPAAKAAAAAAAAPPHSSQSADGASAAERDTRALYEDLLSEKDKRDAANHAVRQAIDDLKLLKEERDRVNAGVAEVKAKRNAARAEGKRLLEDAKKLRDLLKGVTVPRGSSEALAKLFEHLDFTYQTKPMPFAQERQLVKKLEELRVIVRTKRAFEKKNESLSNLSGSVDSLFRESRALHEDLLKRAEDSERVHNLVIGKAREIDALRRKADEAHAKVVAISAALGDARVDENEARARARAEEVLARETALREKAKEIKTKISGKKSFNLRDLQVLGAAGEEMSFEDGKEKAAGKRTP